MGKERTDRAGILLGRLRNEIENGKPYQGGSRVTVDKDEILKLIDKLKETIDKELSDYREITDKRARIISDAKLLSDKIQYEAERSASRIRVTKRRPGETAAFRVAELDQDEKAALRTANDIYAASLIYTDEMLTEVDHLVSDAYHRIEQEYDRMLKTLGGKIKEISDSKAELMSNLEDLSKMDRYSQIMELGSLLSQELYYEKEKARAEERERASQMSIEFDEKEETEQDRINPDRTEVKLKREASGPIIRVMDRSDEAVGRQEP